MFIIKLKNIKKIFIKLKNRRKESLLRLAKVAHKKGDVSLPELKYFTTSNNLMPHEKNIVIGEHLTRKKMRKEK